MSVAGDRRLSTYQGGAVRVFSSLDDLARAAGQHLGHSDWHAVSQDRIGLFADATGDHQWLHIDAERAASGPYGGTIAHGFLTLSLLPRLAKQIYTVTNLSAAVNYGLDKVRFPSPVGVGSRVRAGAELMNVSEIPHGRLAAIRYTVEVEGRTKPGCVAEMLSLFMG